MDEVALLWSRIQFAITNAFHYFYPPLSIGLGTFLVVVGALHLATKNAVWAQVGRFWTKVFGLTFAVGVATGIPMEFQFGTNWAAYSRYVGDIFGSALAAEGIFAFFLESGFFAVLLFGPGRVAPWFHYFSVVMVCLSAHFSAVWIVVANSWMQTPAGFHIVDGPAGPRAEVTGFWEMVFNPSSIVRLCHVLLGAWLGGSCFVMSVSAWYLLRRKHLAFAKAAMSVALVMATVSSILEFVAGDQSSRLVGNHQPAKFAALEGHWPAHAPADLVIVGWVDEAAGVTRGLSIPGMTSWLQTGDSKAPLAGLSSIPADERPPIQITFQSYHAMVGIGCALIALFALGVLLWWRGRLFENRLVLWLFVLSVLGPIAANEFGWIAAEVGRQPWLVQGLMRTSDGVSSNLTGGQVVRSTGVFFLIYTLLFAFFVYVMNDLIQRGPDAPEEAGPLTRLPKPLRDVLRRTRTHE